MRARKVQLDPEQPDPEIVREAAALLRRGGLVAFPTETVYGLGANLNDPQAIQELYQVKARPFEKQVTIHLADGSGVTGFDVHVSELAKQLMKRFWPGPLTLVLAREDGSTLGFRVPDHPVARAVIREANVPVVLPSANKSGEPPPTTAGQVFEALADLIDMVVDGGPTSMAVSSTVLSLAEEKPKILREGAIGAQVRAYLEAELEI